MRALLHFPLYTMAVMIHPHSFHVPLHPLAVLIEFDPLHFKVELSKLEFQVHALDFHVHLLESFLMVIIVILMVIVMATPVVTFLMVVPMAVPVMTIVVMSLILMVIVVTFPIVTISVMSLIVMLIMMPTMVFMPAAPVVVFVSTLATDCHPLGLGLSLRELPLFNGPLDGLHHFRFMIVMPALLVVRAFNLMSCRLPLGHCILFGKLALLDRMLELFSVLF